MKRLGMPIFLAGVTTVISFMSLITHELSKVTEIGLLVSFGLSSGMVPDVNLHKIFNPKSLFYTRPTLMHYNLTRKELENSSKKLFEKIVHGSIKENITKIYDLNDASKAHKDLHSRITTGSMIFKI